MIHFSSSTFGAQWKSLFRHVPMTRNVLWAHLEPRLWLHKKVLSTFLIAFRSARCDAYITMRIAVAPDLCPAGLNKKAANNGIRKGKLKRIRRRCSSCSLVIYSLPRLAKLNYVSEHSKARWRKNFLWPHHPSHKKIQQCCCVVVSFFPCGKVKWPK